MKKGKLHIKNYFAGSRYLGKNILILGASFIAAYEVISTAINSATLSSLLSNFPVYVKYIYPILDNILFYLGMAVLIAFLKQGSFTSYTGKLSSQKGIKISLKVCDIFDCDGGIIVPCNNLFASDEVIIGQKSIHYQLTKKCLQKKYTSEKSIDEQTQDALSTSQFVNAKLPLPPQTLSGKEFDIYPYGLILPIRLKDRRKEKNFYLLSMSEILSEGRPRVSNKVLLASIDSMWKYIEKNSLFDDHIVIPVMGTGAAKMTEKLKNVIAKYIIKTFADNAKKLGIRHLTLCVYPGDYINDDVDIDELRRYIDYICEFPDSEFVVTDDK